MKRSLLLALCSFLALAACGGCGSDGGGSPDPSVASLSISMDPAPQDAASACAQHDGLCDCPRGAAMHLTLTARAADGHEVEIDPGAVSWTSSDAASVSVASSAAGGADVGALRDLFDAQGAEPSATVTASYGGLQATMPVTVVLDAHGDWQAVLDIGFSYTLSLTQAGRAVEDAATHYGGNIQNDMMSLTVSGISVNARFSSRTEVRGTYTGQNGLNGTLTCTKQ